MDLGTRTPSAWSQHRPPGLLSWSSVLVFRFVFSSRPFFHKLGAMFWRGVPGAFATYLLTLDRRPAPVPATYTRTNIIPLYSRHFPQPTSTPTPPPTTPPTPPTPPPPTHAHTGCYRYVRVSHTARSHHITQFEEGGGEN